MSCKSSESQHCVQKPLVMNICGLTEFLELKELTKVMFKISSVKDVNNMVSILQLVSKAKQ